MIVCTGCGSPNEDQARFCRKCGRKLQSSRLPESNGTGDRWELLETLHTGTSKKTRAELAKMLEAGIYSLLVVGTTVGCAIFGTWWPLYVVMTLVALLAWTRKV